MTPRKIIRALERMGMRFYWHEDYGACWEDPKYVSKGDRLAYWYARDWVGEHWDEFHAELEVHLWRREGVIA